MESGHAPTSAGEAWGKCQKFKLNMVSKLKNIVMCEPKGSF